MASDDFFAKSKRQDIGRWYVNRFVAQVASQLPNGSTVLDAGAGECVYKKLFSHCTFRYTSYGIESLCTHAGFREVTVTSFGGLWVRWAYELPRGLEILPSAGIRSGRPNAAGIALLPLKLLAVPMTRLLQALLLLLDRYDRAKNDPFGWACTAIK
jgi:hypothetical protein